MKNYFRPLLGLLGGSLTLCAVAAFRPAPAPAPLGTLGTQANETVSVWLTTGDRSRLLQQQGNVSFGADGGSNPTTIAVEENTTYQSMDGFGASITGSSAYLINQRMNASQRDALLSDLFGSGGVNFSLVRHTMGASDFSLQNHTYDEVAQGQTDVGLTNFSINYDKTDLIPVLKAARVKNPSLRIMGSPWTAPRWMKETYTWNGSWLNTAYYQAYANYFVKYVQAYAAEGLPIYAVTLQNEPLYSAPYVSMRMDPGNQASFLKNNIGPAFRNAGITTKLIVYDHNWDRPDYPNDVFADAAAKQYAAGAAFHCYGGNVNQQNDVHNAHPDKDLWFSECSGTTGSDFGGDLRWTMSNLIIGSVRAWAKGVMMWNMALDQNNGPINGGCATCRGIVTIDSNTGNVTRNVEYYAFGHASKFVKQGAVRIASNTYSGGIENVAFKNPDGSKVLVAVNNGSAQNTFKVRWGNQAFSYTLPAGAVGTFKWSGTQNGTTPTGGGGGIVAGNVYKITSVYSSKALDVNGPSTADGANVQQWTYTGGENQKWRVEDAGNGEFRLVSLFSGKVLDVNGPSTLDGANVQQWANFNASNQKWRILAVGNGQYKIESVYSGKVLDVAGPSTADGTNVQQWTYGGGQNQKWTFSDPNAQSLTAQTSAASAKATSAALQTEELSLQVYPMPVDTDIQLEYTASRAQALRFQLVDMTGRVVLTPTESAVTTGLNRLRLPIGTVRAGVYLLQVNTSNGQLTRRIVVAR